MSKRILHVGLAVAGLMLLLLFTPWGVEAQQTIRNITIRAGWATPSDTFANPTNAVTAWSLNACWNATSSQWERCRTAIVDPCAAVAQTTTPISVTADTVIITATAAKKNYICSLVAVAGAAEIISITEGTGTVCGTSEAALVGSLTDANGMSFAANGGFSSIGGAATVVAGKTANVDTCLNVSGTNRVSGFVTWVQQ